MSTTPIPTAENRGNPSEAGASSMSVSPIKPSVTDAAVREYIDRIRSGTPPGNVFPARLSECAFTDDQRLAIKKARLDRKDALKQAKAAQPLLLPINNGEAAVTATGVKAVASSKAKGFTKLRRILFLQSNRCFFCSEPLDLVDASIEHLNPLSRGGTRSEDNEVVCHATLNEIFGDLELKRKFELILKHAGKFACPKR